MSAFDGVRGGGGGGALVSGGDKGLYVSGKLPSSLLPPHPPPPLIPLNNLYYLIFPQKYKSVQYFSGEDRGGVQGFDQTPLKQLTSKNIK